MDNQDHLSYWQRIEGESQAFYQKVATAFVSAAAQSRELTQVKTEVQGLLNRVQALEDENRKLRADLNETWEFARQVERERDEHRVDAERTRQDNAALSSTLATRDAKVAELEAKLAETEAALGAERTKSTELEYRLSGAVAEVDHWQRAANSNAEIVKRQMGHIDGLSQKAYTLDGQLRDVRAKLAELSTIFATVEPVVQVEEQVEPQPPVLLQQVG